MRIFRTCWNIYPRTFWIFHYASTKVDFKFTLNHKTNMTFFTP